MAILKKILTILIVLEISVTSLGFCGHIHDHSHGYSHQHDEQTCDIDHQHDFTTHLQEHQQDSDTHPHHSDCCTTKFHCSCLGGFVAEFTFECYDIILLKNSYTNAQKIFTPFILIDTYYRPPKL